MVSRSQTSTELPLISVQNVSKKYCRNLRDSLWYGLRDIAGEVFFSGKKRAETLRRDEFWALRNVSFDVKRGESLAVVGANGAGKSTLLKLLYGLIRPDAGIITIRGKSGALIELGAGLDPVLSGRENIYIRAALLGLKKSQIEPLINLIIDFAGLHEFIDSPVQFYSSGMTMRLAYAVSAYLKPDVLLVDEVIAVGDIAFRRKCIKHMREYVEAGNSLVLVSHQAFYIHSVCQRGILLEKGECTFSGNAVETLDCYYEKKLQKPEVPDKPARDLTTSDEDSVIIENVSVKPAQGGTEIRAQESVRLTISYRAMKTFENAGWGFSIWTHDRTICITGNYNRNRVRLKQGAGELTCVIPKLPLTSGAYLLTASIFENTSFQLLALDGWGNSATHFIVTTEPDDLKNIHSMMNQLVTFEVEWQ